MGDTFEFCRDCNGLTSGRCWRHGGVTIIFRGETRIPIPPEASDEITRLRAEADRLRGALERIADECEYAEMGGCGRPDECNACIARAALGGPNAK